MENKSALADPGHLVTSTKWFAMQPVLDEVLHASAEKASQKTVG